MRPLERTGKSVIGPKGKESARTALLKEMERRERERERDRDRDRDRDRETERQRQRQRQTETETETERNRATTLHLFERQGQFDFVK